MKLFEQYLFAIKQRLPYKDREDTVKELRTLLLDEIELQYGSSPTEQQIEDFIEAYGSPKEIAHRYHNSNYVIGSRYTGLFFMISKLALMGVSIAFTVVFIIQFLVNGYAVDRFFIELAKIPFRILNAMLIGLGVQTIIFIFITRHSDEEVEDFEEDWSISELRDISLGYKAKSKFENIIMIIVLSISITIINTFPDVIKIFERSFEFSSLKLTQTLNVEVFKGYVWIISIVCVLEIIYHIISLLKVFVTKKLAFYEVIIDGLSLAIVLFMISDPNLFEGMYSILSFKTILIIIAITNIIEVVAKAYNFAKYFTARK